MASSGAQSKSKSQPVSPLQANFAQAIARQIRTDGMMETTIPRLVLFRTSEPNEPFHGVYEPAICIVAQGKKQTTLGNETYLYEPQRCLVVSVDLPISAQVIEATPDVPYLSLRLDLDLQKLSALVAETEPIRAQTQKPARLVTGLSLAPVESQLIEAATRLVRLLETPQDIPILAPLIEREILYRMLASEYGARLRHIAQADHRLESVNRSINWLKQNYTAPLRIESLAREARLSSSALHHHFKSVTALSPLQYQKQLRLQEARRLMLAQSLDAATASYHVGYESPSQFSREYSRLFGAPPSRDIARLKSEATITN